MEAIHFMISHYAKAPDTNVKILMTITALGALIMCLGQDYKELTK